MIILKQLLKKYNIKPSKRLGQNFLIDKSVLKKIIAAAELKPEDIVLEIGPGLGVLTLDLAKHVKKVIAIEKDKRMVEIVKNVLADRNVRNVEVIKGDILKLNISSLFCHPERSASEEKDLIGGGDSSLRPARLDFAQNDKVRCKYKIAANIPYYLTSPLIRKFLESECPPELLVLMVQKEVAQRICARAPRMTLLSAAVQFYAEPKIISYVSKKSFWPQPKVDSAIIRIIPHVHSSVIARNEETKQSRGITTRSPRSLCSLAMTKNFHKHFFSVVRAGFSQPRKQIINNLSKGLNMNREKTAEILKKAGIKPTQRPGELPVDKWVELAWITQGK